ncbi:hypothetical protein RKD27_004742 [Streptomyces sp. SAI-126]
MLPPLGHVEHGAGDALGVDAAVGVEGLVLLGDDRVLHRLRDLREVDDLAVGLATGGDHLGVVGPVVDVVLRRRGLGDVRNAHERVAHAGDRDQASDEADEQPRHQLPGRHPACHAVLARAGVVDEPLLAGIGRAAPPGRCPTSASADGLRPSAATTARASLGRATGLGTTAVLTFLASRTIGSRLLGARPIGVGKRPGGASRSRAAAGGRAGLAASGRGTSASLRLRRFATVLAHRTTTPRAGAPVRAWKRRLVSGPPEVRMWSVLHSSVPHRDSDTSQVSLGSRWCACRTDYAPSKPAEPRSSPQIRQLGSHESLM